MSGPMTWQNGLELSRPLTDPRGMGVPVAVPARIVSRLGQSRTSPYRGPKRNTV